MLEINNPSSTELVKETGDSERLALEKQKLKSSVSDMLPLKQ